MYDFGVPQPMNPITALGQQTPQMQAPPPPPAHGGYSPWYGAPTAVPQQVIPQPVAPQASSQQGQPMAQPGMQQQQGAFNPFAGFLQSLGGQLPNWHRDTGGPVGGFGPRFDDIAERTRSAIGDAMGALGKQAPSDTGPGRPQMPQYPMQQRPAPMPQRPAPAPMFAAPPQMPQQYAGQQLQQMAPRMPPQMPQQYAGQQLQQVMPQPPLQLPLQVQGYAHGGRVSDLACRC